MWLTLIPRVLTSWHSEICTLINTAINIVAKHGGNLHHYVIPIVFHTQCKYCLKWAERCSQQILIRSSANSIDKYGVWRCNKQRPMVWWMRATVSPRTLKINCRVLRGKTMKMLSLCHLRLCFLLFASRLPLHQSIRILWLLNLFLYHTGADWRPTLQ